MTNQTAPKTKPRVTLIGKDGNVFNLLGICTRALGAAGLPDQARELREQVFRARSHEAALVLMTEYCDVQ